MGAGVQEGARMCTSVVKPLLASQMLIFHWTNRVTWSSPVLHVGGDPQGHAYWEAWLIMDHQGSSLPHGAYYHLERRVKRNHELRTVSGRVPKESRGTQTVISEDSNEGAIYKVVSSV